MDYEDEKYRKLPDTDIPLLWILDFHLSKKGHIQISLTISGKTKGICEISEILFAKVILNINMLKYSSSGDFLVIKLLMQLCNC